MYQVKKNEEISRPTWQPAPHSVDCKKGEEDCMS